MTELRIHYFDNPELSKADMYLNMCKSQGYVPQNCLLVGQLVWGLINEQKDPCKGCEGDRIICGGRPK